MNSLFSYLKYLLFGLSFTLFAASSGVCAVYYVDPQSGDNSNAGTSTSAAWKYLPGTRTVTNTGWESPTATIHPGDTIYIKSGATINRRVIIDPTYYQNGTATQSILISRKADWGTGPVIFDGSGLTFPSWGQLIFINRIPNLTIDGAGGTTNPYDGIIVQNVSSTVALNGALQIRGTSEINMVENVSLRYFKFYNNNTANLVIQCSKNFSISSCEADGNGLDSSTGFYIGGHPYGNETGAISNCYSHNHGTTVSDGGASVRLGYWVTNSTGITIVDSVAENCSVRGFDLGMILGSGARLPDMIVLNRCRSINNHHGIGVNGEDVAGTMRFYILNSIIANCDLGLNLYQGPTAYILNNTIAACNIAASAGDGATQLNRNSSYILRNNIFYQNAKSGSYSNRDIWFNPTDASIDSDYNLFEKGSRLGYLWKYGASGAGVPNEYNWYYFTEISSFNDSSISRNFSDSTLGICSLKSFECHSHEVMSTGFMDAVNGNYKIISSSPARQKGIDLTSMWPAGIPVTDFQGIPRLQGSSWDIGAYSFSEALNAPSGLTIFNN